MRHPNRWIALLLIAVGSGLAGCSSFESRLNKAAEDVSPTSSSSEETRLR